MTLPSYPTTYATGKNAELREIPRDEGSGALLAACEKRHLAHARQHLRPGLRDHPCRGHVGLPLLCGSESSGGRHLKLSVKFYLTAILFVVFDIEAVFIYPWAVEFKSLGWTGLWEMLGFLGVVVVALVYCWRKGALEWES